MSACFSGVDSVIDESAAVVERDDLYALRKAGPDLLHLLFDGVNDIERVGPVAGYNDSADRLFAVFIEYAAPELGS